MGVFDDMNTYLSGGKIIEGVQSSNQQNSVKEEDLYDIRTPKGYFYNKLKNDGFNMDSLIDIMEVKGNQLILSGAGSGKTVSLIFKIQKDIITGEILKLKRLPNGNSVRVVDNVLVSTFLASGAKELQERMTYWQRKYKYTYTANQLTICTLHAEFKRALQQMGVQVNLISGSENTKILRGVLKDYGITNDGNPLYNEDIFIIEGILAYYRNRLDEQKYAHPSCGDYGLTPTILTSIARAWKERRASAGYLDFEDLQELLYEALQTNPAVVEFIQNRYNYIYLDEFQDTSQIQYEILKYYFKGCKKVIAIGDDDQCLIEGTKVRVKDGYKNIEDIKVGDYVLTGVGNTETAYKKVTEISKIPFNGEVRKITTASGKSFTGTKDHMCFTKEKIVINKVNNLKSCDINYTMFNGSNKVKGVYEGSLSVSTSDKTVNIVTDKHIPNVIYSADLKKMNNTIINTIEDCTKFSINTYCNRGAKLTNEVYNYTLLGQLKEGMTLPIVKEGKIVDDKIVSIENIKYKGYVYDINVEDTANFTVDDIVVHNCIYSWRGSDVNIITHRFKEDFNPTVSQLSVNYRCPENILKPIVNSIKLNTNRNEKPMISANKGGVLQAYQYNSMVTMFEDLNSSIIKDIINGEDCAILCRTNFDGMIPAFVMQMNDMCDFSISSDKMTLNSALPKKILNVTSIFTDIGTTALRQTLELLVPNYSRWKIGNLMSVLKNNKISLLSISKRDLAYSCPEISDIVGLLQEYHAENNDLGGLKYLYHYLSSMVYKSDTAYCNSARAYISTLLFFIDTNNFDSIYDFKSEISDINDKLLARVGKTNTKIKIATVHESKGKEWDNVYIWNDSEGVFPSSKTEENNEVQLEEERRLHYVAWTRARRKLCVLMLSQGQFFKETGIKPIRRDKSIGMNISKKTYIDNKTNDIMDKIEGVKKANENVDNNSVNTPKENVNISDSDMELMEDLLNQYDI